VLEQSFGDFEIIVVDDSTNDETKEVMEEWLKRDKRIRYFKPGHAGRIAIVSNIGLRECRGAYVAILDDDDYWTDKEKLAKQAGFLDDNPAYVGCGGGLVVIDERGKERGRFLKPATDENIRKRALIANPMANSTTLFPRETALKIRGYDETMLEFADWDFWLKMGLQGKLRNFPEYFASYRMWERGNSFSKQHGAAVSGLRIVRRYRGRYPGFLLAIFVAWTYYAYAHFPDAVKRFANPVLSRLKKALFAR